MEIIGKASFSKTFDELKNELSSTEKQESAIAYLLHLLNTEIDKSLVAKNGFIPILKKLIFL